MSRKSENKNKYSHKPIQHRIIGGFVITIVLILGISIISFRSLNRLKDLLDIVDEPDQVNTTLYELMNFLTEEEILLRDYFNLRRPEDLKSYQQLRDSVNQTVGQLAYLMKQDTTSLSGLTRINKLIEQKHILLNRWFTFYERDTLDSDYFEILSRVDSMRKMLQDKQQRILPSDTIPEKQGRITHFFDRIKHVFRHHETRDSSWIKQDSIYEALVIEMINLENRIAESLYNKQQLSHQYQQIEERLFRQNFLLTAEIRTLVNSIIETGQKRETLRKQNIDKEFLETTKIVGAIIGLILFLIMVFIIIIHNDLKHIEENRDALLNEKNSAEKLADLKSRFLSNMSHEIRTPLTSIIGYSEQLKKKMKDTTHKGYIDIIYKSSEHLLFLVNEILTFSKLEAKKISLRKETFDLKVLMDDVYELLKLRAQDKGLELRHNIHSNFMIEGDQGRLKQILINIISNSLKFTEQGVVEFGVYPQNETDDSVVLQFFVRDTGIGIPSEKMDYIFEEFNQAYKESFGKYGGTGLGLSICKQLIDLHGGTIDVSSKPGEGAEFVFTITYLKSELSGDLSEGSGNKINNPSFDASKIKILIIDDDEFNAMLGQQILKDNGFATDIALTGKEGLDYLMKTDYQLLLLDINLPDISGYDVIDKLKQLKVNKHINERLKVIALSANAVNLPLEKLEESGFHDKFIKPFREEDLINLILLQFKV